MREQPAREGESERCKGTSAPSVLIADSNTNILFTLEFLMRREGFDVRCALDGEKALAQVNASPPDVVLLEVELSGLHGYELCQHLRSNPVCHATKIIIVSEKCHELEIEKGLALGADAYITKPFSTSDVVQQIRLLLQSSEMQLGPIATQKNREATTANYTAIHNDR